MSTDSTELTFIRCPSCKSLVPSASPRCRMCGAGLEAGKKSAEAGAPAKNSFQRARQHTVNMNSREGFSGDEADEDPKQSSKSPILASKASQQASPQEELQEDSTDLGDPLGAFLEEISIDSDSAPDSVDDSSDPVSTNGLHLKNDDAVEEIDEEEDMEVETSVSEEEVPVVESFSYSKKKNFAEPVAQAKAKPVARTGLSFAKPKRADAEVASEDKKEIFAEELAEVVETKQILKQEQPAAKLRQDSAQVAAVEPVKSDKIEADKANLKGRLIGWMVSYADPKGTATELREGKFFVSRSSLKGSDLIIDDSSISTPHALFGVSSSAGVKLQDLMSDRGVFVRKKGSEAYQRMLESVKLEHGDWVRFGDVEFLLAIL